MIIRNRERIFVDTERRAAAAEADRLAEAERAVVSERSRIAREMHDVVAHGMSVVAVQAAAGREIVHADPDKAAEVFARIEAVGRESLAELRRMLGVLRDDRRRRRHRCRRSPASPTSPPRSTQSSATGVATELVIDGHAATARPRHRAGRLPDRAGGADERAQARRCDRPRPPCGSSYEPDVLVVEVTDDGRGAATSLSGVGTGHGLIGMRERVEIYGGEFTSGPRPGGGYAVRAVLPIVDSTTTPGSAPATHERGEHHDHPGRDRRRPGADARRLQHDPRRPARHRRRR